MAELGQATQRAGPHHGALRQGGEGLVLVLLMHHQGIGRVFPLGDAAEHQPLGQVGGQVLEAMDGDIGPIHQHLSLQFLGEQALVADLGQRHIEDLVALGGHGLDADLQARVRLDQLIAHPVGLHHGQLAAAGGDAQLGSGHQKAGEAAAAAESQPPSLGTGGSGSTRRVDVVISSREGRRSSGEEVQRQRPPGVFGIGIGGAVAGDQDALAKARLPAHQKAATVLIALEKHRPLDRRQRLASGIKFQASPAVGPFGGAQGRHGGLGRGRHHPDREPVAALQQRQEFRAQGLAGCSREERCGAQAAERAQGDKAVSHSQQGMKWSGTTGERGAAPRR